MKLEQSFDVQAPIDAVWSALTDVQRVAPCLPGAEITEAGEDGSYSGTFQVKLGPTTAAYRGTLQMEELDEANHKATMRAEGKDKRGQGGAKATMVSTMTEAGGVTTVHVDTDFTITGRLASFGRSGMIKDISNRLLGDFASCLQAQLAGEQAAGGGEAAAPGAPPPGAPAAPTPTAETGTPGAEDPPATEPPAPSADAPERPRGGSVPPPSAVPPPARPAPSPPRPAKPVNALRLVLGVILDRVKQLLRRIRR